MRPPGAEAYLAEQKQIIELYRASFSHDTGKPSISREEALKRLRGMGMHPGEAIRTLGPGK